MKIYPFFNKQRVREDGDIPIYICIYRSPKRLYIHTGLFSKSVFDDGIFPRSERNHKAKTIRLNEMMEQIENIAIENSLLSDNELKQIILDKVFGKASICKSLSEYVRQYADDCNTERTKDLYHRTADKIDQFDKSASLNITYAWLENFLSWMRDSGLRDNSSAIHLRNIRSVINWAIKNEWTNNYPFRRFSIPSEKTRKRNVPLEDLRFIISNDCLTPTQEKYRDIFVLMFYLVGINGVDLLNALNSQVVDGRLEYKRFKTGRLYSIKIEPEAMEIIERYRGKEHLLCFCDSSPYRSVMCCADKHLKSICKGLSTYYARHTWATIAASLDIPMDTISAALGHSHGAEVTNIYVDFDQRKVDEANRKVIDFVLGGEC